MRTERGHAPRFATLCLLAWSLFGPRPAHASPLLELAGSVGDQGGRQGRNRANGVSAAYFNPALLVDAPMGVTAGVVLLHSAIDVDLASRSEPRADVPTDLENGAHADGSRWDGYPLGTEVLQHGREESAIHSATTARPRQAAGSGKSTQTYEAFGIVAQFFERRLSLGMYGLIPNGNFLRLRSFYADEREQYLSNSLHPELYGDRTTPLAMAVGAGYRFGRAFSLGLGSCFTVRAAAATPVFVADASRLQDLVLNVDAKAHLSVAPHGGFAYTPHARFRITGTLHAPQKQEVTAQIDFLLATGLQQASSVRFVFDWMPWQASLGSSVDLLQSAERIVTLSASALYGRWSGYIDRHGERPAAGLAWQDTITPALGVRGSFHALRLALDLEYKPTPVPLQFGRSNYVDNDRIGTNLGADYAFKVLDTTLRVGISLQGFWLLHRYVRKLTPPTFADGRSRTPSLVKDEVPDDGQVGGTPIPGAKGLQTNNPGWPGFASGGWLTTAGLYLSVNL
jgi:long-chain fatty acid transport protein